MAIRLMKDSVMQWVVPMVRRNASEGKFARKFARPGVTIVDTTKAGEMMVAALQVADIVGVDVESHGCDPRKQHPKNIARLTSCQFSDETGARYFIPLWGEWEEKLLPYVKTVVEDRSIAKVLHNGKYDMHVLANHDVWMRGMVGDTMVMDYLYANHQQLHGLKECMRRYFKIDAKDYGEVFREYKLKKDGTPGKQKYTPSLMQVIQTDAGIQKLIDYSVKDPVYTVRLYKYLKERLEAMSWAKWNGAVENYLFYYETIELPYTTVLFEMEREGCLLDLDHLRTIQAAMLQDISDLERKFFKLCRKAGLDSDYLQKFNMGSGPQIADLLYAKLGVSCVAWTKGKVPKPSTSEESLKKLSKRAQPFVECILERKRLIKLEGTYVKRLLAGADDYDGRVHTNYKQIGTACMPAGELVLTSRGYLPVEQVKVGDFVLTHEGRKRRVLDAFKNGVKPIRNVTLENGLSLRTTANHQFFLEGKTWARADRLPKGAKVCVHGGPETWKPVKGWVDFEVSSWGRVFNVKTRRMMTLRQRSRWGHLSVTLRRNGEQVRGEDLRDFLVHRLVVEAFGDQGAGEVRHRNGMSSDNSVGNLQWGTSSENTNDALLHGTGLKRGTSEAKLKWSDVEYIRSVRRYRGSDGDLATELGVSRELVREIRCGRRWKTYGEYQHVWETSRVVKVVAEPAEMTYGLTVEEDSSHVTGHIVTHNTMRLASSTPNLQNIVTKEKDKYGVRKAFIADDGFEIGDIDLAQVEVRVSAHFTQDANLLAVIREGLDQHLITANLLFTEVAQIVNGGKCTKEMSAKVKAALGVLYEEIRRKSKIINFGIIYGMGPQGYSAKTGVNETQAKKDIDKFFRGYPGLHKGIIDVQKTCRRTGEIRTVLKRHVMLPDIRSSIPKIASRARRQAFNYLIQGSCADLLKMSMLLIHRDPLLRRLGVKMILQIHDELVFRIPAENVEKAKRRIESFVSKPLQHFGMRPLTVETPADLGIAANWQDAKDAA